MTKVFEVATNISTPLMLAGFLAAAFFFIARQILKLGVLPGVTRESSAALIRQIIDRLFVLTLVAMVLGFAGFVITIWPRREPPRPGPPPGPSLLTDEQLLYLSKIRPVGGGCPRRAASQPSFATLGEWLLSANPAIDAIAEEILRSGQQSGGLHKITRACAPAGSGKSTLFRHLDQRLSGRSYLVKLENLESNHAIKTVMLPDLQPDSDDGGLVFSTLPAFDPKETEPEFGDLLRAFGVDYPSDRRPLIIVDSIDEIHPKSSKILLRGIDKFLQEEKGKDPDGVLHVLVVGRPEGFRDYYINPHVTSIDALLELRLPGFESRADLRQAAKLIADSIHRDAESVTATLRLADKYPFLCESAHNLALLAELVKNAVAFEKRNLAAREIKDHLFNFILARNRETHNRPARDNQDYIRLFETIGALYAGKSKVDADGFFIVDSQEIVLLERTDGDKVKNVSYRAVDVLSRSGIAYLSPVDLYNPTFRLYPSWVHEHLAYLYNKRLMEGRSRGGRVAGVERGEPPG